MDHSSGWKLPNQYQCLLLHSPAWAEFAPHFHSNCQVVLHFWRPGGLGMPKSTKFYVKARYLPSGAFSTPRHKNSYYYYYCYYAFWQIFGEKTIILYSGCDLCQGSCLLFLVQLVRVLTFLVRFDPSIYLIWLGWASKGSVWPVAPS